jgi:hypothetical protein
MILGAFLALPRQKPGFPLQFLSPCGACGISAAIPGAGFYASGNRLRRFPLLLLLSPGL